MKAETHVEPKTRPRNARQFSAREKAQAVLALWSGRRSTSALTKELAVPWAILNLWEQRALSGMLTALDPNWSRPAEAPLSLPARVERLLAKTVKPPAVKEG